MASTISAGTTTTTALVYSADTSGILQLQTNGGTTAVTIDTNQNVGIGVPPNAWNSAVKALQVNNAALSSFTSGGNVQTWLTNNAYYDAGGWKYKVSSVGANQYSQIYDGSHAWFTAPSGTAGNAITFTQAMTLDASGNLLVGTTSVSSLSGNCFAVGTQNYAVCHATGTSSGTNYAGFLFNGSTIGSITQNGTTGVLYNLTSDYRLKNNQEDLTGAKDFIMALKPKKWQWWDGSGEGVGFVAHEFMEVAKYSGHGEKDAVDADGKPVYQSIQPSSSEVMANLVSFIQEQQAMITTLQTQVTALQSKG
jgi:hypothetical protein